MQCLWQFTTETGSSHWMTNAQLLGDYRIDNYQLYGLGHLSGRSSGKTGSIR